MKRNNLEHQHQKALFEWAEINKHNYPELQLMFAIPNGGHRNIIVASKLKAEGVKAGVPDIFLPIAKRGYHGLFIEMKTKKGKLSRYQAHWLALLDLQGFRAAICYGWEESVEVITEYLNGKYITKTNTSST